MTDVLIKRRNLDTDTHKDHHIKNEGMLPEAKELPEAREEV